MKVSDPKFLLKEPNGSKNTLISLVIRFNNQRIVYSTGEAVHPNKWDFENQRVKGSKKDLEAADINDWLDKIENEAKHIFRAYKYDGIYPTPYTIKEELSQRLNDKPKEAKMTLFKFIESYISQTKAVRMYSTVKSYLTTYRHLQNYAKLKRQTLDFEDIDMAFHSYFTEYLIKDLSLGQNSVAKYIKVLKVFLNAATESGFNKNLMYKSKKFSKQSEDVHKIYLTESEIDKIYNLNLSENPKLDRVRDLFIIGCSTGLRFSDFSSLKSENIEQDLIKIKTQKTGEMVMIPLSNKVRAIYKKYSNNFPAPISNQKMNAYLKDIGALAGITEEIVISRSKGGIKVDEKFKKYELISSHCARRSFATNAYLAKIPAINIMKITGHKTDSVFQKYIRFSNEENAIKLRDHEFFTH